MAPSPATANLLPVLLLAMLSGATTLIGVALALWLGRNVAGIAVGIGLSAGIMLLVSFAELLPEAITLAGLKGALIALGVGFGGMGLLHLLIPHTHLFKEKGAFGGHELRAAYLVALGLILHDFPEGFAMAHSYMVTPALGLLVAVSIAIHNIPEEFAMAAPVVLAKRKRFLILAAVVSAMAEPLGALLGLFAAELKPAFIPRFMAAAAGAMIFVSLHELLPMARRYGKLQLFALGAVLSVAVYALLLLVIPE